MCAASLSNGHVTESELLADIRMFTEVDSNRSELFRSVTAQIVRLQLSVGLWLSVLDYTLDHRRLQCLFTVIHKLLPVVAN